MVRQEAVVRRLEVEQVEEDEEDRLCLFGDVISVSIYYVRVGYRLLSVSDNVVEQDIM